MQVSWSIICASNAVQRIQRILVGILSADACTGYEQPHVMPYWKTPGCSWINCEYLSKNLSSEEIERQVREISGAETLNILRQGDCIEYTSCTSTEEILGSNEVAFVVCFVNMKGKVL